MTKKKQFHILSCIAAILMCVAAYLSVGTENGGASVTFIDVGQGDCALIRTADGKTLLIDGGEQQAFENAIEPHLNRNGILRLDAVLASHMHSDHMGGLSELTEVMGADTLYIPDADDDGWAKDRLLSGFEACGANIKAVSAGDKIDLDSDGFDAEVLFPDKTLFKNTDGNKNNDSVVLSVDLLGTVFLFTGDLEADAENVLLNSGALRADVLKVGHHGSYTSTSEDFLRAVSPKYAVISAGKNNRYGHPHAETIDKLDKYGIKVFRTDIDGNIEFSLEAGGKCSTATEHSKKSEVQENGN